MTLSTTRVAIDAALLKKQLKDLKLTGLVVMALCGYKSNTPVGWNRWMREGSVPERVAEGLRGLGLKLK